MSTARSPRPANKRGYPLTSQVIGLIEIDAPAWNEAVWEDLSGREDMTFPRRPLELNRRRFSMIETCSTSSLEADEEQLLQDLQDELDLLVRRLRAK